MVRNIWAIKVFPPPDFAAISMFASLRPASKGENGTSCRYGVSNRINGEFGVPLHGDFDHQEVRGMEREAIVLALILLGHAGQAVDVKPALCQVFRQASCPIHAHDRVQRPLPSIRENSFLLLQIAAALDQAWTSALPLPS